MPPREIRVDLPNEQHPSGPPLDRFPYPARLVLMALGFAAVFALLLVLLWYVADVLLLGFAGIILAVFLTGLSNWLAGRVGLSYGWSLTVVILVLAALVGFLCWLLASQIAGQVAQLEVQLPQALDQLQQRLEQYQWGRTLLEHVRVAASRSENNVVTNARTLLDSALKGWMGFLLVMLVGLYGAITPGVYVDGVAILIPRDKRARVRQALEVAGDMLWWWMICRLISMTWVGVATWIALRFLGVPLSLTLGFVAGAMKFVPYIGPFLAVVPAILLALLPPHGFVTVLWVVGVYLAIEMIDDHVILPLLNWRAIWFPPALGIFSQVLLGALWSGLGVLLAMPLVATLIVLVKVLYVRDTLGEPVELGDSSRSRQRS